MIKRNPGLAKQKDGYVHKGFANDRLFEPTYNQVPGTNCCKCDPKEQIQREEQEMITENFIHILLSAVNSLGPQASEEGISKLLGISNQIKDTRLLLAHGE